MDNQQSGGAILPNTQRIYGLEWSITPETSLLDLYIVPIVGWKVVDHSERHGAGIAEPIFPDGVANHPKTSGWALLYPDGSVAEPHVSLYLTLTEFVESKKAEHGVTESKECTAAMQKVSTRLLSPG